jgi:SOS response regulatory protein OraA/RecX
LGTIKDPNRLRALDLPDSEIRDALAAIDENVYTKNLRALIASRKSDPEDKRLRFLAQRGFTYEEIKRASHA